jgi:hypothetical protein
MLWASACPSPSRIMIQPVLLRASGGTLDTGFTAPEQSPKSAPAARLTYLSLVFEHLYVREFGEKTTAVAPGLQLFGAGANTVSTVLRLLEKRAGGGLVRANLGEVAWFPFRGEVLRIVLRARALEVDEIAFTRGVLADAPRASPTIDPLSESALEIGTALYHRIIDASSRVKSPAFEVSVLLQPQSATEDKSDARLAGGRYVLLLRPRGGALPARLAGVAPEEAFRFREGRLRWRSDDRPVTELSYLVFSVMRAKRFPVAMTEIGELARKVDLAYDKGAFGDAEASLFRLRVAIVNDAVLTVDEKNLERLFADVRAERIRGAEAARRKHTEAQFDAWAAEVRTLGFIRERFPSFLYDSEHAEMAARVARIERLAAALGARPEALEPLRAAAAHFHGDKALAARIERDASLRPPPRPTITRTSPRSPGRTMRPFVQGHAARRVSMRVFVNERCEGRAAATGVTNDAGAFSIAVRVPRGKTTPLSVQAVSRGGTASACSKPLTFVHDASPPEAPGAIRVSHLTAETATLTWAFARDDVTKTAALTVEACGELAGETACEPFVVAASAKSANHLRLTGFCPGERWLIRLRSRDEAGNTSLVSAPVLVVTPRDGPPCSSRIRALR